MTTERAWQCMDELDEYFSKPRTVIQSKGDYVHTRIFTCEPCGCFGVHVDVALHPGSKYWEFSLGKATLENVASALGVSRFDLMLILRSESGRLSPYGATNWDTHPCAAWPKISQRLKGLAVPPRRKEDQP